MSEPFGVAKSTDERAVGAAVTATPRTSSKRRHGRESSSPHAGKFRLVTAVLVALAVGAVLIAVGAASGGRPTTQKVAWSQWQPSDGGTQGAREIADYLAPFYRISPVDQLAVVTVVNLQSQAALQAAAQAAANGTTSNTTSSGLEVAVRPNPSSSQVGLLGGNTIAYNLCGIGGKNCSIGVGQPSSNRLLLLRREALELALYTFKYVSGTQNVVAILPPGRTEQTSTSTLSKRLPTSDGATTSKPVDIAILLQRPQIQPLLDHPLSASLPEPVPPTVAEMPSAPEAGLVDQVTARALFSEQLQQAQDGTSLIVLDPLPPQ
jgi:hypothetical protein